MSLTEGLPRQALLLGKGCPQSVFNLYWTHNAPLTIKILNNMEILKRNSKTFKTTNKQTKQQQQKQVSNPKDNH